MMNRKQIAAKAKAHRAEVLKLWDTHSYVEIGKKLNPPVSGVRAYQLYWEAVEKGEA